MTQKKMLHKQKIIAIPTILIYFARHAGSDGSMPASGSAGPGFDHRRDSKFSFENFSTSELGGVEMYIF